MINELMKDIPRKTQLAIISTIFENLAYLYSGKSLSLKVPVKNIFDMNVKMYVSTFDDIVKKLGLNIKVEPVHPSEGGDFVRITFC